MPVISCGKVCVSGFAILQNVSSWSTITKRPSRNLALTPLPQLFRNHEFFISTRPRYVSTTRPLPGLQSSKAPAVSGIYEYYYYYSILIPCLLTRLRRNVMSHSALTTHVSQHSENDGQFGVRQKQGGMLTEKQFYFFLINLIYALSEMIFQLS